MDNYSGRLSALSPKQRALLMARLKKQSGDFKNIPIIPREERKQTSFPLSFAQQRLWFLNQLDPNSSAYNICGALQLSGSLNYAALHRSLNHLVQRHESLRTIFTNEEGQGRQILLESVTLSLPLLDLQILPHSSRNEAVRLLADEEMWRPFQLEQGPLLRCTLFRWESEEYVLLLSMHHIISDGWSMKIFTRELTHLYASYCKEERPQLPVQPLQYIDFAVWQRQWLSGDRLTQLETYWQEQLRDAAPLEFPADYPRPVAQTFAGAAIPFQISAELATSLKALSQQEGTTLFMTLFGAFLVLLHRHTRQEDLVVGTPTANRTRAEVENLIGFFVNSLALRVKLSESLSFREVLRRVRKVTLAAYSHQDLPFEQVVDLVQSVRDLSRSPLFQIMFALQNAPQGSFELEGITVQSYPLESKIAKFDLVLELMETPQGFFGRLEYNTALFEASTVQRLAEQYQRVLAALAAAPELPVGQVSLLSEAEREQVVRAWNATARVYPQERCLHELFEEQVRRTPEAVALVFEEQQLSYGELNARANQLAHFLREQGVGPEVPVGLCLERSLEMVVGILGILKAGGAYVPIDPDYPTARLASLLADIEIPLVLTQSHLLFTLPPHVAQVFCLDIANQTLVDYPETALWNATTPQHLAYVMYTSGSTGVPKGILISHQALVNHMHWIQEAFPLTALDRVLQKTPFSFDASAWEFYAPLLVGACLTLARPDGHRDSTYLVKTIIREQISTLQVVPTLLRALLQEPALTNCQSLTRLFCGGEELPMDLLTHALATLPADTLFCNLYGPTECTIDTSFWVSERKSQFPRVPIGKPIANLQTYVLDQQMQPVPIGVAGEMYIGGIGVARGYLGRAALTAERFVPDPFSGEVGGRLYRTGDLARYLPDGNLEFMGRIDQQVKIRGFRVELGEIEAVLSQHPAIAACVVLVRENELRDKRLVAYLVPRAQTMPSITNLRRTLLEQLPEYMIPSLFETLPTLPLTPNGKVDRHALRASTTVRLQMEDHSPAPCTPTEEVLAAIWSHVLRVERVGIHDNFFALGGHSLLATQIIFRINQTFHLEISIRQLFESPTVADLAHCLEIAHRETSHQAILPLGVASAREQALPLSFAQQRLWFLDQLASGNPFYNVPFVIRLRGRLAVVALEQSFQEIVQRHEILRTTFVLQGGQPVQLISPGLSVALPLLDLSELSQAERERLVRALAQQESARPFDLATGPLLRLHLLRLEQEEHILLLSLHHIVCDAWSIGVLLQEVVSLYGSLVTGQTPSLPELPIQYADYAYWQRQCLQGEALSTQLAYWQEQLAGAPAVLDLITDHPRPAIQTYRGAFYEFTLPASLTQDLKELSRQKEATLFMTLLAAFGCLLARYSNQQDIIIGTPIANRTHVETEPLIGFFMNTLALRLNLSQQSSFESLLDEVRELALNAYAHQDLPFEQLVETLHPERNLSHAPLFQVLFTLQNAPLPSLQMPGLQVNIHEGEWRSAKFDLSLLMNESEGRLRGAFEYNTDLFEKGTIERLAGHLRTLLEGVVANRQESLSQLPLLTEEERQLLLKGWNTTQGAYPEDVCVHQLFEAQAECTPEAIAVIYGEEQMSYRELNSRANQLAHYLSYLGVGPEGCVGLCLDRTPDLVVAILGILKAGGAYVPLDQTYPVERLALILADTQIKVLVTYRRFASSFPAQLVDLRLLCLDEEYEIISAQERENPQISVNSSNLCYVVHTSG
jgi:amino acid adenylation domain-containing protein